jgi:uncharacterized protein (TIGR02001 family)
MKFALPFLIGSVVGLSTFPTLADEADSSPVSFNVGLTSDYSYRGLTQTNKKAALQGGVDYSSPNGFSLGAWGSQITWLKDGGSSATMEYDVYGSYASKVGSVDYSVGFIRYLYPKDTNAVKADTTEWFVSGALNDITIKYSSSLTNLFGVANSKGSTYLEASADVDAGSGITVTPHIGRQSIANNTGDYTDYGVTLSKEIAPSVSVSGAVVGTDLAGSEGPRFILSVSYGF